MEKEKSNIKTVYIMIIVFLLLFFFLFIFLNRKNAIVKESTTKEYDTVLIVDNMIFQKTNNRWNTVTNKNNIIKNVNWNEYKIYIDYKYFGKYNLVYSDEWLAFDKNREAVDLEGSNYSFFAHTAKDNYDVKKLTINKDEDIEIVKRILKEYDISINNEPEVNINAKVDLDNDGKEETIYALANMLPEDVSEPLFTLFIVEKEGVLYKLYKSTEEVNSANVCYPMINSVLDIDNDKNYEIIMSCTTTGVDSIKTVLYKYDKEKDDYEIVISD